MAIEIRLLKDKKTNAPFFPLTHWVAISDKPDVALQSTLVDLSTHVYQVVDNSINILENWKANTDSSLVDLSTYVYQVVDNSINIIKNTLGLNSSFGVDWSEESGIPEGSTYKEAIEQQSKQLIDTTEVVSSVLNSMSDTLGLNSSFGVDWSEESGIPNGSTYKEAIEIAISKDEKVKVNLSNEDRVFSLLAVDSSNPVDGSAYEAIYNTGIVINPVKHSVAEGLHTEASGEYSHAEGLYTNAQNKAEHAEGKYNISIANTTRHTVGIGTLDSSRKNAHLITTDGKHYIPGIGGFIGTEDNDTSLASVDDLATVIGNNELLISNINSSLNDINQLLVNVEEVVSDAISTISDTLGLDSSFGVEWSSESGIPNGSTYKEAIEIAIGDGENMKSITWSELKTKHDSSLLTPGKQYRITDYNCTTTQSNTQSAGHQFDVIVVADDVNKLNENARAIQHSGDTYFVNCKLESWKLKYCLDNDTNRFAWADTTNGKGVIYYMKDEWDNECPYDFKNIQFKRWEVTAYTAVPSLVVDGEGNYYGYYYGAKNLSGGNVLSNATYGSNSGWFYTFALKDLASGNWYDYTVVNVLGLKNDEGNEVVCYGNKLSEAHDEYNSGSGNLSIVLNNIVLFNCYTDLSDISYADEYSYCNSNTFGNDCQNNTFGNACIFNTFGNNCRSITFGNYCYSNTFGIGCQNNTFGDENGHNTFGNICSSNTFGHSCNSNTFGHSCNSNTFGNYCNYNTFGNYCYSNRFEDDCVSNTFSNNCYSNTFGNACIFNTFGNNCRSITFGSSQSIKNYYRYIIIENGNQYINLDCTSNTSGSQYYQNVKIAQGVNNTTSYKTITDTNVGQTYQTVYQPTNSQVISV